MSANNAAASARHRQHRIHVEEQMTKKREKEFMRQQTWNGLTRYYQNFENKNSKHEEWTSPRYYETHQTMIEQRKKENERRERLEKRREKLRKLLLDEERSFQIEMAVKTREKWRSPRLNEIPTALLNELNIGLKEREEEKRQKEAELALYNQWRRNNPQLREYERNLRSKELKLSWLDQQIERRMRKEREQAECKRLLHERERNLAELVEDEERCRKEMEEKRERLHNDLRAQMDELAEKERESERLKMVEEQRLRFKLQIEELEAAKRREDERIKSRELALFNIKHHKLRLKQRAVEIEKNLQQEEALIEELRAANLTDTIDDVAKKNEWQQTVTEFLNLVREQRELERKRQKQLDFVFESEARAILEQQNEIWNSERASRDQLFNDVLETLKKQIALKVEMNRKEQLERLREREEALKRFEDYNNELQETQREEVRMREMRKRELDAQIKEKVALKQRLKTLEQKQLDLEIEKIRNEEERLKMEILNLQKQKNKIKPTV